MDNSWVYILLSFGRAIPAVLVVIAFFILYSKTKVASSLGLSICASITFIIQFSYSIFQYIFTMSDNVSISTIYTILNGIGTVNYLAYGIFLLVFVTTYFKNKGKGSSLDSF